MSRRGFSVALISRTISELSESARLCQEAAPASAPAIFPMDVMESEQITKTVREIQARFGRVDAFIHSAGVAPCRTIEELKPQEWQQILDVNLSPIVHFAQALWPLWRTQGGGVMVNVSSYSARDPFPGLGFYGAAKAGVNLLGLALAREGAAINVRVHTVAPGATETQMFRSIPAARDFPMEKTLDPTHVARVIADCVTGDLSATSGEVIYLKKP